MGIEWRVVLAVETKFKLKIAHRNMVLGRKSQEDLMFKPSPPSVDQILDDLKAAESDYPVFSLNPNVLSDSSEANQLTDAEKNYKEVIAFVSQEKRISNLQGKIAKDFDILTGSQNELEAVLKEVADQFELTKEVRAKIPNQIVKAGENRSENSEVNSDISEDLC